MASKTNNDKNRKTQTFSISVPTAVSVQLVGDFTNWQDRPINLHKEGDGVWRATVKLEPGEHHYRFLVDGQWRDDPSAEQTAANPFGGIDAVLRVAI